MIRKSLFAIMAIPLIATSVRAQATSFRDAAAKAGINVGMASSAGSLKGTGSYVTLAKTLNLFVCENDMKFQPTEPSQGKFSYSGGDGLYDFAKANNSRMRGHNFIWHSQSGWAATVNGTRDQMLSIMRTHIDSVAGHFKGKILEWDVLNEITDDGNGNALRKSFWDKAIGDDYPDSAFFIARRADPYGKLYYNDYGADGVNGKSTAMVNLAKKWLTNKVPIDGIGLQCHLSSGFKKEDISANIKRFGDLGLRVSLTEIDIKGSNTADWTNLLGACLENFNCTSFVTWGIYDGGTWLGSSCNGCLPYDAQYQPKACVQAMIDLMNNADPAVVAKRKDFTKTDLAVPVIAFPREVMRQKHAGGYLGLAAVPVFSDASGMVDGLGRNRSVAPNSPWAAGLSIQSR
ncbi:MAG: endo-1,4-beta-xylanase [Fibrobacteres bacterium]|nr:endo-1,4-beta-xylanase [Fibrobacterota bacterium]